MAVAACSPSSPCPTLLPAAPTPPASVSSAPSPVTHAQELAILPLEDDELFRGERAALRKELAAVLAERASGYAPMPLAAVDAKLRSVSDSGARCAYEGVPADDIADNHGWLYTGTMVVHDPNGPQLWVDIHGCDRVVATLIGPWDTGLAIAARYRAAFAGLQPPANNRGLLGGLGTSGAGAKGEVRRGSVRLCESGELWGCQAKASAAWQDKLGEVAACYSSSDHQVDQLLVQPYAGGLHCEIADLDDPGGSTGKREACLCRALSASAGVKAGGGRRRVRIEHLAPDLEGKPRPELRVIDVTTNLRASEAWRNLPRDPDGKRAPAVWRLQVDNLEALSYPLARCALPAGSVVSATLSTDPTGRVLAAQVTTPGLDSRSAACLVTALRSGAFACTSGGKPGAVQIAILTPAD